MNPKRLAILRDQRAQERKIYLQALSDNEEYVKNRKNNAVSRRDGSNVVEIKT